MLKRGGYQSPLLFFKKNTPTLLHVTKIVLLLWC